MARLQLPVARFSRTGVTWRPLHELVQPSAEDCVRKLPDEGAVRTRSEPPTSLVKPAQPTPAASTQPASGALRPGQSKRCALFADMNEDQAVVCVDRVEKFQVQPFQVMAKRGPLWGRALHSLDGRGSRVGDRSRLGSVSLQDLRVGDSCTEPALVDAPPQSTDVVASSVCTLLHLTRERFTSVTQTQPRIGCFFLLGLNRVLARRLRDSTAKALKAEACNRAAQQPGG